MTIFSLLNYSFSRHQSEFLEVKELVNTEQNYDSYLLSIQWGGKIII